MLTTAFGSYLLVTRCKADPSDAFEPKGGVHVFLDVESLEKTGENYVVPVSVVLVGPDCKYGIKPGDVVYSNPKFMFLSALEGGLYMWVNEGFTFGGLAHEHARTAGAVAAPCPPPQFKQRVRPSNALELAALAAGKSR